MAVDIMVLLQIAMQELLQAPGDVSREKRHVVHTHFTSTRKSTIPLGVEVEDPYAAQARNPVPEEALAALAVVTSSKDPLRRVHFLPSHRFPRFSDAERAAVTAGSTHCRTS